MKGKNVVMNRIPWLIGFSMILLYLVVGWGWYDAESVRYLAGINALQTLAALYAAVLLWRLYRMNRRRYWLSYSLGVLFYFFAQVYWTVFLLVQGKEPGSFGIPEVLWMLQYLFYLQALYRQNKISRRRPALRFSLDVLLFMTVATTVYWRFIIEPLSSGFTDAERFFHLYCSSANTVILLGLFLLFIYERDSNDARATLLLMAGFLTKSSGNTIGLLLFYRYDGTGIPGWLPDLCWFGGLMLLGMSAAAAGTRSERASPPAQAGRWYTGKRYIPLMAIFLLLMIFVVGDQPLSAGLIGLLVAFVILLVRLLVEIQDYKQSEQALIRSEKLSVVGQMAAGVAHEIRNPLTSLKGFTQLLYRSSEANRRYCELMLTELERINYIVGEFMLLSKPQQSQNLRPHSVQEILTDLIPIVEAQAIIHDVVIEVERTPELPPVLCDARQIKQVFLNVLKNSIEAMPDGGRLVVSFHSSGMEIIVTVEDEGNGIPEVILHRLGEPFFSTKDTGTGLGLMVCQNIIQSHRGSLTIRNRPVKGAVVSIQLPALS
ncbi:ATP-binding protein [Gorillibacterium sp. sgz5001074]|uniref:ATP-binding protein n=1 Tax=Gorillibacterium sp. sgz5001074 TaxID=3446695 RepID=UPI003F67F973